MSASSRGPSRAAASCPPTARTSGPPGTLFPQSSKKTARAINAASGNRPLVVLANLSGFDGSPESLRNIQLEYGAEIGRAIVNFDGPIIFCVVSRYHGGAFVVFSGALNDNMEVIAVEGSFASVIGGAPAAAVVFTRDVEHPHRRTTSGSSELEASSPAPTRAGRPNCGSSSPSCGRGPVREARRGGRRVRADPQHRTGPRGRFGRTPSSRPLSCGPTSIAAIERGMERAAGATRATPAAAP